MEQTGLVMASKDPDTFNLLTVDPAEGSAIRMSAQMTEEEVRELLGGNGMPENELAQVLAAARDNFKA